MSPHRPFDAVLLVSFGGPQSRDEIRPFLANVLRGRSVPPARLDAVVHHYEMFNGVSPLTAITMRQADGLRERLTRDRLPVYVGMRNWHPFLEDTLKEMSNTEMRHALALTLSAQHSYSSCGQYKQNVTQARDAIHQTSHADIAVTYVAGWHEHPGFIEANVRQIERALVELPSQLQPAARLVFTAHSIPDSMAAESRYVAELRESAVLIAKRLGRDDWALVFQSRSGSPQDPWLEPDICDYIRAEREHGLDAIVVSPIGFVADHIEVLYDLDQEAAKTCRHVGVAMSRAASVNDEPVFLDMLADVIRTTCQRYATGTPLPIVPTVPPSRTEPPPPAR